MKSLYALWIAFISGTLMSCQHNHKVADNGSIDIEYLLSVDSDHSLEKTGGVVITKQLDTTDDCLLPRNSYVANVSDNYIFVRGGNLIYRFDKSGRFVNRIGSTGQGPMEYSSIHSVSFREADSTVCIYSGANKLYLWGYDGKPVRCVDIETNGYFSLAFRLGCGFWAEERISDGTDVKINIVEFDEEGNRRKTHHLTSHKEGNNTTYYPAPVVHQISDSLYHYYSGYSDSMYAIVPDTIRTMAEVHMGKYGMEQKNISDMDYRTQNKDNLCEIWDIIFDDKFITLLLRKGQTLRLVCVDASSKELITSCNIEDPRKGGGFKLWDKGNMRIWPNFVKNGDMYTLINAIDYDTDDVSRLGYAGLESDADQNPLLLEIHFD